MVRRSGRFDVRSGPRRAIETRMSLYSSIARLTKKGPNGFGYGSTAEEVTAGLSLEGKTILVTGCNSGIGLETMRVLALRGARVIGAARTEAKTREASAGMKGTITPVACELAEPASVRACVAAVKALDVPLDAIVANAGIMALPARETKHGFELQFFTNHVGHFLLVTGLLDRLSPTGRVVMLSSEAHRRAYPEGIRFDDLGAEREYTAFGAYGQSKLANLLFAKELSKRLEGKRTANALHPGVIHTNLGRHMGAAASIAFGIAGPLFLKSIPEGAATQTFLAAHPSVADVTGKYFSDCNEKKPRRDAEDPELARRLWEKTEEIVAKL
jgi:WW domain-containing oxidoreductase